MTEVHVTLVKQGDLAAFNPGAHFPRPQVVVLTGGVDDDKVGQKTLQVEPHMGFGGGFAPPVLGPVQAVGHQFHHRGVHHMNGQLETKGRSPAPSLDKGRCLFTQVTQHLPKQLFGHLGPPFADAFGEAASACFIEELQNGIQEFRIAWVGHFGFELAVFRDTPTGNQLGPPSTSFSRAERLHPTGVRLRSARYAHLRSASPRWGGGEEKKDKLQKDFYTPKKPKESTNKYRD